MSLFRRVLMYCKLQTKVKHDDLDKNIYARSLIVKLRKHMALLCVKKSPVQTYLCNGSSLSLLEINTVQLRK